MKLWKRASALIKDRNSIYIAKLSRKTSFRNPELEEAVIKATSHDESSVDYKNAQRIFTWIRTYPKFLKPVIWALSNRMEKTRYWVVALKGLMLMHGIFCCKILAVQRIGRLPFDFSNFVDAYSNTPRTWGLCAFIRAYFAFLDQKSAFGTFDNEEGDKRSDSLMGRTLKDLQRSQALLDMLLQVKPYSDGWSDTLILEAMDCIVIEIFDIYSRICNGIASFLVRIYAASQQEAEMTLHVLHKATSQGEELDSYFEFCRDIGVLNASEFPRVEKIPEEDIRDLERIIDEVKNREMNTTSLINVEEANLEQKQSREMENLKEGSVKLMKTIITSNWVVFDDEFKTDEERRGCVDGVDGVGTSSYTNPFAASMSIPPVQYGSNSVFTNSSSHLPMQQRYDPLQVALSTGRNERNLVLSL
ncbi:hypothetical protein IFM89_003047 [Coptis chinensis]|uniref:ENTH domain-containing protein n=1 Tax=Coptis chinensis TaxID=261450 RepID=A0A835IUM4_9MAGN|nr:hypothetical protein IFM89_003047 [Coptis chinensis]